MEMLQTHCYATGTVTLLWKRPQRRNMSQYVYFGQQVQKNYVYFFSIMISRGTPSDISRNPRFPRSPG
jgi:hypothetical protein